MSLDNSTSPEQPNLNQMPESLPDFMPRKGETEEQKALRIAAIQVEVEKIFPTELMQQYTQELLEENGFEEKANGRRWAVLALSGDDPRSAIAKRVETERFSTFFGTHPAIHTAEYGYYDDASILITTIDTQNPDGPKAASALRIVRNSEKGLKTINTLISSDLDDNPWADDIKKIIGEADSQNPDRMRQIIENAMGVDDADKTWAIESMAALEEYAGNKGEMGEASYPLYVNCLQLSDRAKIETWISIQDVKPMLQMQSLFAKPWEWLPVPPRAFEGPYPTIPAFIYDLPVAEQALREANPEGAALMIDGEGLEDLGYVMPTELQGEDYLDQLVASN